MEHILFNRKVRKDLRKGRKEKKQSKYQNNLFNRKVRQDLRKGRKEKNSLLKEHKVHKHL